MRSERLPNHFDSQLKPSGIQHMEYRGIWRSGLLLIKPKYTCLLAILFLAKPEGTHAEPYYWTPWPSNKEQRFPTAAAACRYADLVEPLHRLTNIFYAIPGATCSEYLGASYYYGFRAVHRFGDGCEQGSYNSKSGGCIVIDDEAGLPCNSSDDAVKQSSGECLAITSSETSRGIPSESCKFDSLNPLTGNNFQTVNLPTNTPPISLSYNSIDGTWRHNYSSRLEIGKNIISRTDSTGQTSFFQIKNNTATSRNGLDKLRKIGQTWQHTNKNNQTFVYDLAGTLIEIQDKTRIQTLVYNKNQITITQKKHPTNNH